MWVVEAKTFGKNAQLFRYGPTSESQARKLHSELANSGEWAVVRSWDINALADEEAA
jgi:hypothetical protein